MPVFNEEAHVGEALASLTSQDYPHIRLWISDNASTDGTGDICRSFAASDERISYSRTDANHGSVWNLNRVFCMGTAPAFMWAASDDRWHPAFVSRCLSALQANPRAVIAHTYQRYITHDGDPLGEPLRGYENMGPTVRERWRNALKCWPLHMAYYGLMWRHVVAGTRLTLLRDSSDFIFITEMSLRGQIVQVPEVLFWKRLDSAGSTVRTADELWSLIAANQHGRPSRKWLTRMDVFLECIRGARYAALPRGTYLRLVSDAARVYLSRDTAYASMDLKELARRVLGDGSYESLKSRLHR